MDLFLLASTAANTAAHAVTLAPPPVVAPAPAAAAVPLWNATSLSALIGAGSALTVMLIKDGLLEWAKSRRAEKLSDAEIFQRYLGPLADACARLMWRNKEIFLDDRNAFLKLSTLPANFNAYKRLSTLYRIASLIGWIRGMDLELSALAAHNPGYVPPIATQIAVFRSALADGPDVERDRLVQLCQIWSIDITQIPEETLAKVAIRVEVKLHALIAHQNSDLKTMLAKKNCGQEWVVIELAKFVSKELGMKRVAQDAASRSTDKVMESLAYREALIYREWQDAIGDAMIDRDRDSPRKFRIIGFAAFSDLIAKSEHLWFQVFATSLDDIDFEQPDRRDFRAHQLRKIANAVAAMVTAIDQTAATSPYSPEVVAVAGKLTDATL
ncbi:hypothetical protein [Sphingobium sp. B2]|uniref:hypothetical protein n=1 Tax=Sphingobium sp. B2 TaxID=2583228 RepID=UPI0011A3406A|nr:hypothetical protein [Sphingobium sp. B2]